MELRWIETDGNWRLTFRRIKFWRLYPKEFSIYAI